MGGGYGGSSFANAPERARIISTAVKSARLARSGQRHGDHLPPWPAAKPGHPAAAELPGKGPSKLSEPRAANAREATPRTAALQRVGSVCHHRADCYLLARQEVTPQLALCLLLANDRVHASGTSSITLSVGAIVAGPRAAPGGSGGPGARIVLEWPRLRGTASGST